MPTPEQLYAELYQCRLLLQGMALRLSQLEDILAAAGLRKERDFPAAPGWGNSISVNFPDAPLRGNGNNDNSPIAMQGGNDTNDNFPNRVQRGNCSTLEGSQASQPGNPASAEPSHSRLEAVLLAQAFPKGTNRSRISRCATLLLAIRKDPTRHGVEYYAHLLKMSYSGAGKFMMGIRRLGLIRQAAMAVHELTPRGEELVQVALRPIAEA